MRILRRLGLPERLLAILLLVTAIDFAANTIVFERASNFELRQDDAARIAENLVLASRAIEQASPEMRKQVAWTLSSGRFVLNVTHPAHRAAGSVSLSNLRAQVVAEAPELASRDLELHLEALSGGGNIGGSIRLADGSVLDFKTYVRSAWKLTAGRVAGLVLPTVLLITLAWVLVRATLRPLRSLIRATRQVGAGPPQPVQERGPDEMRRLTRAINRMQERIFRAMQDKTNTILAVAHDLRTPLARLRLRLDDEGIDPELRSEMSHDVEEMRHLLGSLQEYVESGSIDAIPKERLDIAVMAATQVDMATDMGALADYEGPSHLEMVARQVSVRRILSNLISNAVHYGGNAHVCVRKLGGDVEIVVEDSGPGIPEERLKDVLEPFVRLDQARSRDTPGMGLGIPIVLRAAQGEGGTLRLSNRAEGGLRATVRLPLGIN